MSITRNDIVEDITEMLQWDTESIGVVILENFERNISHFREILGSYRFPSAIHYIMKVNSSFALLKHGRRLSCRVDVSSLGELEKALVAWYTWNDITANGPKNQRFLKRCIDAEATIAIDSISELNGLVGMIPEYKKQKILIRLSGFEAAKSTRFGVLREHWESSLNILDTFRDRLHVLGYSFHIDVRDVEMRKSVFWESLEYYRWLTKNSFAPSIINIGGGYGVYYKDDTNIKNHTCDRFGLSSRIYPQDDGPVWTDFLKKFLWDTEKHDTSIGKFLEENNITLWIEPGRSLMQDVWYGATRIISVRNHKHDASIVLDSNSFSFGMREEELPTDPFLMGVGNWSNYAYTLLGNLCLESDIFFGRKVCFDQEAKVWDIVIFPDIWGYHMDFYETESLSHPKKSRYFQLNNTLYPDNF